MWGVCSCRAHCGCVHALYACSGGWLWSGCAPPRAQAHKGPGAYVHPHRRARAHRRCSKQLGAPAGCGNSCGCAGALGGGAAAQAVEEAEPGLAGQGGAAVQRAGDAAEQGHHGGARGAVPAGERFANNMNIRQERANLRTSGLLQGQRQQENQQDTVSRWELVL